MLLKTRFMSAFGSQHPQSYTQEEIQQILQLAITRQGEREQLSRNELQEIAAELKIAPESLAAAEKDWIEHNSIAQKRQAFELYRKSRLKQQAVSYAIVNGFLMSIDLISAGAITWSLYIVLFWGMGLSLTTWNTFQTRGEAYEQAFRRWSFRNEMFGSIASIWGKFKKIWQI